MLTRQAQDTMSFSHFTKRTFRHYRVSNARPFAESQDVIHREEIVARLSSSRKVRVWNGWPSPMKRLVIYFEELNAFKWKMNVCLKTLYHLSHKINNCTAKFTHDSRAGPWDHFDLWPWRLTEAQIQAKHLHYPRYAISPPNNRPRTPCTPNRLYAHHASPILPSIRSKPCSLSCPSPTSKISKYSCRKSISHIASHNQTGLTCSLYVVHLTRWLLVVSITSHTRHVVIIIIAFGTCFIGCVTGGIFGHVFYGFEKSVAELP